MDVFLGFRPNRHGGQHAESIALQYCIVSHLPYLSRTLHGPGMLNSVLARLLQPVLASLSGVNETLPNLQAYLFRE